MNRVKTDPCFHDMLAMSYPPHRSALNWRQGHRSLLVVHFKVVSALRPGRITFDLEP
jgi:hypothetical protein